MTKEQLFESMGGIDDEILERSEKAAASGKKAWKVFLPLAACFCVLILSAALLGQDYFTVEPSIPTGSTGPSQSPPETTPPPSESTQPSAETEPTRETVPPISLDSWEVIYNDSTGGISALIAAPFGYFAEKMNQEQIKLLLPDALLERTDIEGWARYKAGNELWYATVWVPVGDYDVNVLYKEYPTCLLEKPKGVTSVCGDVEYLVMEWTRVKKKTKTVYTETIMDGIQVYLVEEVETDEVERVIIERLEARAEINDVPVFFVMDVESDDAAEEKRIFKEILTAFATYPEGMPAVDDLTPMEPRNSYYYDYSLEEARKDETFGNYLPQQIPANWDIRSIERFYEEESLTNKLELKCMDENHLIYTWRISLGSSAATQQLSLENVEKRMRQQGYIDVGYGEINVQVYCDEYEGENADYQWIYEQLLALTE